MSYFLSDKKLSLGQAIEIFGDEARHIMLARRMKKGERFNLQGADDKRFEVEIIENTKDKITVKAFLEIQTPPEPNTKIVLFQSVVNEKALDFIFQKSTELGAEKIILFNSQNTATKLTEDIFKKKLERWSKILWEAAKQSDRVRASRLEYLKSLDDVILSARDYKKIFLCDISGKRLREQNEKLQSVALLIGPEGGFTNNEVEKIKELLNCELISLGQVTVRAETAALASLAIVRNYFE